MTPRRFEENSDAVNIDFNFLSFSFSAWDKILINSHLWNLCASY